MNSQQKLLHCSPTTKFFRIACKEHYDVHRKLETLFQKDLVMKNKKTLILLLALILNSLLVISGQNQNARNDDQPDVSKFPILDYEQRSTVAGQKKRKKYNNRYAPRIKESSDSIFSMSDWDVDLPALPTAKSAAVIVGEVTRAQAQLSDDETNIYSEFTVQITEVLKNDNHSSLGMGNSVVVERSGGRVRLPSGKVIVSRTYKQDLPKTGKCYVLFLTQDEAEDYHILTGYELRDGKVFPLDKLGRGHPITAYTGTSQISFFTDLSKILANPSTTQSR